MKTDITVVATPCTPPAAVAASSDVPARLPLVKVHNVALALAADPDGEQPFFDALDTQPWLNPAPRSPWLSFPLLAQQISNALHFHLEQFSRSALASAMLHVIPPELSKLLAAVLICSQQRWEILWQIGLTGGLELIHKLISAAAGATSTAAALSALPGLLIIWLQKQQVPLGMTLIDTLVLLLTTGVHICATDNLAQPGWLLKLHDEVIAPVIHLGQEYGITEALTSGFSLVLGLYLMLRVSGWLEGKAPPPDALAQGVRIIQGVWRLADISHDYELSTRQRVIENWHQRTYPHSADPQKAVKALERAVIRCMSRESLLQRDVRSQRSDRQALNELTQKNYHQTWQQTERQILAGQLTGCARDKVLAPLGHGNAASAPAEREKASLPLLLSGAAIAGAEARHIWWQGRASLSLAAVGATILAVTGTRYIRHALPPHTAPEPTQVVTTHDNLCLTATIKIKRLLLSDNTGIKLAVELFDYLYSENGRLDTNHATHLLKLWKITTFSPGNYHQMNNFLTDILSLLLAPANSNKPLNINRIITGLGNRVNVIWIYLMERKKNVSIKTVLNELRKFCATEYFSLEIYRRRNMDKITDFLLIQTAPDLLFFERNGRVGELLVSKNTYYIWSYLSKQFMVNRDFRTDDFTTALNEGQLEVFALSRLRSYNAYNSTASSKMLEDSYRQVNAEMYDYHQSDIKMETMLVSSFDDIIQAEFPDIDIQQRILTDKNYLLLHHKAPYGEEVRMLYRCETYRDIIRNFEDGFSVLNRYLPNKVPESLRKSPSDGRWSYTLKAHPTYSELKKKFDRAYQVMTDNYCDTYNATVKKAFNILSEDDFSYLHHPATEFSLISFKIKRFKLIRHIFAPKTYRLNDQLTRQVLYNERPYHENGKFFLAYNHDSGEVRFYHVQIYYSRENPQQLPVRRLMIDKTEDIISLDPEVLNKHFIFLDEKPMFEQCEESREPITTLLSRWDQAGEYVTERYNYIKNKLCLVFHDPNSILVLFEEHYLNMTNASPIQALADVMTSDCRRMLDFKKNKVINPTTVEKEKMQGELQRYTSYIPFYECYRLIKDHIMSNVDDSPKSLSFPVVGLVVCMSDFYLGHGVKSTLILLLRALRKKFAAMWIRKSNINLLKTELRNKPVSSHGFNQRALDKLSNENIKLRELEIQIQKLQDEINHTMGTLVSVPVLIAIPWLSLASKKEFAAANIPWAANEVRTIFNKIYETEGSDHLPPFWDEKTAESAAKNIKYILPQPGIHNLTCYDEKSPTYNIILDIFDLRYADASLYKDLFFVALSEPSPVRLTLAIENAGWVVAGNYFQNKITLFISLTNSVRHFTDMVLSQEEYYKTSKNDIKLTQEALYQYYYDYLRRPLIPLPVSVHLMQQQLINKSINIIKLTMESNIKGVELNYLFMTQYFLMKEDTEYLLLAINSNPQVRQDAYDTIHRNLLLNMSKYTIFGNSHSAAKNNFFLLTIRRFIDYFKEVTAKNPEKITLFSGTTEIFIERQQEYSLLHPGSDVPSSAVYAAGWLQIAKNISDIYQSLACIEYSASALTDFPVEQWSNDQALLAWYSALDPFLFPEMRYEDLTQLLKSAATELAQTWPQQRNGGQIKPTSVYGTLSDTKFIACVRKALTHSCTQFPALFFSKVYLLDEGHWFTFLTHDFLAASPTRPRRQVSSTLPSWPLAALRQPPPEEAVISPLRQRLAQWKPARYFNESVMYQQQIGSVPARFMQLASQPFYERIYDHTLENAPQRDAAQLHNIALINSLIDEQGNIIDYQLRVLMRYFPQLSDDDDYPLLQILGDIFHLSNPQTPSVYSFILQKLQLRLSQPQLRLSVLSHPGFRATLVNEIYQLYQPEVLHADGDTLQALRRYISATLRHLLAFTAHLTGVEILLATAPLYSLSAQWLCLGAIITHQLRLPASGVGEQLQLAMASLGDAGLLSFSDTALQQAALISAHAVSSPVLWLADSALKLIASGVQQAAEMQQQISICREKNHWAELALSRLDFSGLADAQQPLRALITASVEKQQELLHQALLQLSGQHSLSLTLALKKQQLRLSWYHQWCEKQQKLIVAGLALHIRDQPGFLLPLGDPHNIPLIFRQVPAFPTASQLILLCFGESESSRTMADPQVVTLAVGQHADDPLSMIAAFMHAEIDVRLNALLEAKSQATMLPLKQDLASWLEQHLFFYGPAGDDSRHQQLTTIAEHPALLSWQQPDPVAPAGLSDVSYFNQAVAEVMGPFTGWPDQVQRLRSVPYRYGPVLLVSLPAPLFAGFWWDPLSGFCYLGWKNNGRRALYASFAGDRHHLSPLPDNAAIWQALVNHEWLNQSLLAVLHGTLSAERFFSYSIPLAWQLHCALAESPLLPVGALSYPGLSDVYSWGNGPQKQYFFSPGTTPMALPVTVEERAYGGWKLAYTPLDGNTSPDLAFTLEIKKTGRVRPDQGQLTLLRQWQLVPSQQASRLISAGNFYPTAYLQRTTAPQDYPMAPVARVLQRSNGNMMFIFSENNWRRVSYRMMDAEGMLLPSPALPAEWPRNITARNEQQFNDTLDRFFRQQATSDYWLFPQENEIQRTEEQIFVIRRQRRAAMAAATAAMHAIPFRCAPDEHIMDELFHIKVYLRGQGRYLNDEVEQNADLEESAVTPDHALQKLFDWRQYDLSRQQERAQALSSIKLQKRLLDSMLTIFSVETALKQRSPKLRQWVQQSLNIMGQVQSTIEFIQILPQPHAAADSVIERLQQQRFAQNYFFGYYSLQLHASADFFQQPWQYQRENSTIAAPRWQQALDQLHTLTSGLPEDVRQLDRLLTLPDVLWQAPEMQQRARHWQQVCANASDYWKTPRRAEELVLLRPKTSQQGLDYMPQKFHWPVRLILAAGRGNITGDETAEIAAPLEISVEQNDDLLLTRSGPERAAEANARLAGSEAHPSDAREFAGRARLRLSSPWALAEFSSPAFMARLQLRLQRILATESQQWCQEERDFYLSSDTRLFLQEDQEEHIDRHKYLPFFRQLFNSNLLVTRLVMTDVEMVFGLQCDYFAQQQPQRATEDLSAAWFLFQQLSASATASDDKQPLWLIGI